MLIDWVLFLLGGNREWLVCWTVVRNTDCDCDDGDAVVINFHILDSDRIRKDTHLSVMMVMV